VSRRGAFASSEALSMEPRGMCSLAPTLLLGVIALGTGRTTVHQGVVHLVIFAVFVFFAISP
jgi:Ca2+:H+ antiporter